MLEVIVDHALVEACDTDGVLLELADQALTSLTSHARNITLSARVLDAQMVAVINEAILHVIEYGAGRSASKHTRRILLIQRLRRLVVGGHLLQLSTALLLIEFTNVLENLLDGTHGYFGLRHIRPVQTVDTVRAEHTSLLFEYALAPKALLDEEAEAILHIPNLANQIVKLVEVVAVRFGMKVVPNVLDLALRVHLEKFD